MAKRKKKVLSPAAKALRVWRNGGDGFIKWAEEHVRVPVFFEGSDVPVWTLMGELPDTPNPETGRSYKDIWEEQKHIFREALVMEGGRFKHRIIIFCWMRGEGKSLIACIIQLWKFFCWPKQQIMLGANSKDQVKFVHYDIMRDIILNSPKLLAKVGKKNVKEKEICLRNSKGDIISIIRSISSFSGIVSNITGYTFSEIFDMKNPKFFSQLHGSIRNMPNAMGVIDSTVSDKTHVLYRLYLAFKKGTDPTIYFSYRCSPDADHRDYWNPQMTPKQLNGYKTTLPPKEFDQYFRNTWDAGSQKLFTVPMIEATRYLGVDGALGVHSKMMQLMENLEKRRTRVESMKSTQNEEMLNAMVKDAENEITHRCIPVSRVYQLHTPNGRPAICPIDALERLGDMYKTDWVIGAGIDRADPMKSRTKARTIVTITAKGLAGSRGVESVYDESHVPSYIYFLLHLRHVESSQLEDIKAVLREGVDEFDGLDVVCAERWGMWDLGGWCEDQNIEFEPVFPSYDKQRESFSEVFTLYKQGRFKSPALKEPGSKGDDILYEEAKVFDHDPHRKYYGSPNKSDLAGEQDDAMFSLGWSIYGLRSKGVEDFRERRANLIFGMFSGNSDLIGAY